MALKQECEKNTKIPVNPTRRLTKTPSTEPGNSTGPPACKFINTRKTPTCPDTGAKYEWCNLHGSENEEGIHNGMYIPHPQNHEECAACRAKYNDDWKEKQQGK